MYYPLLKFTLVPYNQSKKTKVKTKPKSFLPSFLLFVTIFFTTLMFLSISFCPKQVYSLEARDCTSACQCKRNMKFSPSVSAVTSAP